MVAETMSDLERAIERYRAALLAGDRIAAADLARRYGLAYQRIAERLDALLAVVSKAQAAGVPVSRSWLMRQVRYTSLMRQVDAEMRQYGQYAAGLVEGEQRRAIGLALAHSEQLALTSLGPPPAGVIVRWNAVPTAALQSLAGALQDGSPLLSLFDALGTATSAKIQEALFSGVTMGQSPVVIARAVRRASGMSLTRALTISRTEVLRSYRSASIANYAANPGIVKAWRWSCARGRRTCSICWAMHGRTFPVTTPFGSHPACRCAAVPVTTTWAELGFSNVPDAPLPPDGPTLFARLSAAEQRGILGAGKYDLYAAGKLQLGQLVGERLDPRWGLIRFERSLQEITA